MPIYAYKCESCGHAKDVLQKMSDDPLTQCPACGQAAFKKQLTAAGFQLKGSGWYVTDFREGNKAKDDKAGATSVPASTAPAAAAAPAADSAASSGGTSAVTEKASPAPAPASSSAISTPASTQ